MIDDGKQDNLVEVRLLKRNACMAAVPVLSLSCGQLVGYPVTSGNKPACNECITCANIVSDVVALQHLVEFIRQREGQCGIIYARLR